MSKFNLQISHYKIPKYIKFVDKFPKTSSGKIKKYVLREMAEKELFEKWSYKYSFKQYIFSLIFIWFNG